MQNLPDPSRQGKPGRRYSTASTREETPSWKPQVPAWVEPMRNPYNEELIDLLIDQGATLAVIKVWRQLTRSCTRYVHPGAWLYQTTIARATRLGKSTVRVALHWLEGAGWIARTTESIHGEEREVVWCRWMIASGSLPLETGKIDFGFGVQAPIERNRRADSPRRTPQNRREGAELCAQESAPEYLSGTSFERSTPPRGGECVDSQPPAGEEESPQDPDLEPPAPPCPGLVPIPLDSRITGAIAGQFAGADAAQLAAAALSLWLPIHPVERIVRAILATARRRVKIEVHDLVAFTEGILANMVNDRPGSSAVASSSSGPASTEPPRQPSYEATLSKISEVRSFEAREAELAARWDQLPEADRAALEAAYDRENPPVSGPMRRFAEVARRKSLLERLAVAQAVA